MREVDSESKRKYGELRRSERSGEGELEMERQMEGKRPNTGDISSKTNTWPISNTECQKQAQIERLGCQDPGPAYEE